MLKIGSNGPFKAKNAERFPEIGMFYSWILNFNVDWIGRARNLGQKEGHYIAKNHMHRIEASLRISGK